ncbi:MAG: ABC transporter ATP-binding protein [Candidatus Humimicrobiaceae bacterium]
MSLEVRNLSFGYKSNMPIFQNIDFIIESGKVLSLIGPNGSGKTTLLKCLNRVLVPSTGEVLVNGCSMKKVKTKELATYLGYVPQNTGSSFSLSVVDAVFLGRTPHVNFKLDERDREIVFRTISRLGLNDLAFRMLNELSGGERQRVFLARALAQEPQVLLLDEPTSNLDLRNQIETLEIVRDIARERNISVIMAIHDLNLAIRYSDRAIMMKKGTIIAEGDCKDVITVENIGEIYQVEVVVNYEAGIPVVVPMRVKN